MLPDNDKTPVVSRPVELYHLQRAVERNRARMRGVLRMQLDGHMMTNVANGWFINFARSMK